MTEPTTSTLGAACSASIVACSTALVGLHPHALLFAFFGAALGLGFATQATRWRAMVVFVCVTFGAAMLGTWAGSLLSPSSIVDDTALVFLIGLAFHPLATALVDRLPQVIDRLIALIPGGKQ